MGLFDPGWKNQNKEKALLWISKHRGTDMMDAVFGAEDKEIKKAAAGRVAVQINMLEEKKKTASMYAIMPIVSELDLIKTYIEKLIEKKDYETLSCIFSQIIYQDFLSDLAQRSCVEAITEIKDQNIIYNILTDQNFFKDSSMASDDCRRESKKRGETPNDYCVDVAFERFNDNNKMIDLLKNSPYRWVTSRVVRKIAREGIAELKDIVFNQDYPIRARIEAVGTISDESVLLDIIEKIDENGIKIKAIERISTPEIRKKYCEIYNTHKWKKLDVIHNVVGDHDYGEELYECEFCGKKRGEDFTYVL